MDANQPDYSLLEACKILKITAYKMRYHMDFGNIKKPEKKGAHFRFSEDEVKEIAIFLKVPNDQLKLLFR